jgi:Prolipoprotein diacylglyceryl transferase/Domain of unknown function (DUF4157)
MSAAFPAPTPPSRLRAEAGLNAILDRLVRLRLRVLERPVPAFQLCGIGGWITAFLLAIGLGTPRGLSAGFMAVILAATVVTFLALVMATKVVTGKERIVYYHHEIVVLAVVAVLLWVSRQPLLPYLDVTILGLGLFLACGRLGCFMVGCCHGRPYRLGASYRSEHAEAGFTPYYVGVRLFPVQLVESLWVLVVVAIGSGFVLRGDPPGTALTWYVVTYDVGRFALEFTRGDAERPYHLGFSEPQWISLVLTWMVPAAGLAGLLPFQAWHAGAAAALALAMVTIAICRRRRSTPTHRLLHPHHVKEIAEAVDAVSNTATAPVPRYRWRAARPPASAPVAIAAGCTSLGIRISAGTRARGAARPDHYALSHRDGGLSEETARVLAGLILQLRHAVGAGEVLRGRHDVFHLVIDSGGRRERSSRRPNTTGGPGRPVAPAPADPLPRTCACGRSAGLAGECSECGKTKQAIQRRSADEAEPTAVPPIVHEVVRPSGEPPDAVTRATMKSRLGHDFGGVRVHTDARAAESAGAVSALAYTVGQRPGSTECTSARRLGSPPPEPGRNLPPDFFKLIPPAPKGTQKSVLDLAHAGIEEKGDRSSESTSP